MEELGEYAAAVTIEEGLKKKPLKESTKGESVDLVINSLALFFAEGGTIEWLVEYGQQKLKKWEGRFEK